MAKVTIVFEDINIEGDVRVSYSGTPDFDIDMDPTHMTSCQALALKAVNFLLDVANDTSVDEDIIHDGELQ